MHASRRDRFIELNATTSARQAQAENFGEKQCGYPTAYPPAMAGTMLISSPSLTGGRPFVEETDVLVVEVHVDEAAHVPGVVADALLQAGVSGVERLEKFADWSRLRPGRLRGRR